MNRGSRHPRILALAASLPFLTACDTAPPGGGLTNGPPPTSSGSKAAERSDLPAAPIPDRGERPGRFENTGTDGGSGARGGGNNPAIPKSAPDVIDRGTPTSDSSGGSPKP